MQILDEWEEPTISVEKQSEAAQKIILWLINIFAGFANPIAWAIILDEPDTFIIGIWVLMYNIWGVLIFYIFYSLLRVFWGVLAKLFHLLRLRWISKIFFWLQRLGFLGFVTFANLALLSWAFYWLFKFG